MTDLNSGVLPSLENIQETVVRRCPQFVDQPLTPVVSAGTENAMYRLGGQHVVRVPLHEHAARALKREVALLQHLKELPLARPEVVEYDDGDTSPLSWAVYKWMEGEDYFTKPPQLPVEAAASLAHFIVELRASEENYAFVSEKSDHRRGVPLIETNDAIRESILKIGDEFDTDHLLSIWDDGLAAKPHEGEPVWLHGDLHAGNLITEGGKLFGVIDFGLAAMGDPAADLPPAWWLFEGAARQRFKDVMNVDDAQWRRGRGWALHNAAIAYAYYRDLDKGPLTQMSRAAIVAVLEEGI